MLVLVIFGIHEGVSYLPDALELAADVLTELDCKLLQLAAVVGSISTLEQDALVAQN